MKLAVPSSFGALLISPLLNVIFNNLHLLSAILLWIKVFAEENPVLDTPAYVPFVPDSPCLPSQIWNQPCVCQTSRLCIFHNSVLWWVFGFSIDYREPQNQRTTLLPAAKWCLAIYPAWSPTWSFMVRILLDFTKIDHFHLYWRLRVIWGRLSNPWTHWGSGKGFISNRKRKKIAMPSPWMHWPYGPRCICAARHMNRTFEQIQETRSILCHSPSVELGSLTVNLGLN